MGAYWDPLNNALKKVVDEGIDPVVALQEAYDLVVAKVAEIRGQ
jgi:maltose-binding protein MalE